MRQRFREIHKIYVLHFLLLTIHWGLAIAFPTTGGEGDSIYHYFYADYARQDLSGALNLWAKPIYTLLAAPWTALGFTGLKLFNVLVGCLSSLLISLLVYERRWKAWWLVPLLAFGTRAFSANFHSGLTETFAAFLVSLILLLVLKERERERERERQRERQRETKKLKAKLVLVYLLASFLPYCRSELKILLPLFLVYALLNKQLRYSPFLLTASLIFGAWGYFEHPAGFRWIFESPYVAGASVYGSGAWYTYLERLWVMLGWSALVLLVFGFLRAALLIKRDTKNALVWWVMLPSLGFIAAHSTVWALGIYASAGLERVLIAIFPMLWLLIVYAVQPLFKRYPSWLLASALSVATMGALLSPWHLTRHYFSTIVKPSAQQGFIKEELIPVLAELQKGDKQGTVSNDGYIHLSLGQNPIHHPIYAWRDYFLDEWDENNPLLNEELVLLRFSEARFRQLHSKIERHFTTERQLKNQNEVFLFLRKRN